MAQQGQVTKIYSLKTTGFDVVHGQFKNLSEDLARIKKLMIELQGQKLTAVGKDLDVVNKTIVEAAKVQVVLEQKIQDVNAQSDVSVGRFAKLSAAYKAAKKDAEDLATAYGIESEQATKAAEAAAGYREQLKGISAFVNSGGKPSSTATPAAPVVPFTTNLDELAAEQAAIQKTGVVVNQFEQDELQASLAATEWAASTKGATDQVAATSQELADIKLKYEQYTGSLKQNIAAQVENTNTLKLNRAEQKQIEALITTSGVATEAQVTRLVALREEEVLLSESNKILAVTIRNLAKEQIAGEEATVQLRAQLNNLQQAYLSLSAAEKSTSFGQELKAEIDILEPKVKSLEAELGIFTRNVGNYPQLFGGAFKVLENELDAVRGKIVTGNFTGKDLDSLTAKEKVLQNVTKTLGTEFASTAAKATAYKEAGRQLAATFGTQSQIFKDFSAQVAVTNTELKKQDAQLGAVGEKGRSVFKTLYGGLRQVANALPGLGISSLVLLLFTPIEALATKLFSLGESSDKVLTKIQKNLREAFKEANTEIGKQVGELEALYQVTQDGTVSLKVRQEATEQLLKINEENNKRTGENIQLTKDQNGVLEKNDDAINKITVSLFKQAKTKAYLGVIEKAYTDIINKQTASLDSQTTNIGDFLSYLDQQLFGGSGAASRQKRLKDKGVNDAIAYKDGLINQFKKDLTNGELDLSGIFGDPKTPKVKGSKLSTDIQEQFKLIDALRDTELDKAATSANEIARVRKLSFDEEEEYLKKVEQINIDALNKKIALLNAKKTKNQEELKLLARFGKEVSDIELDTSNKINDIEKRRFDDTFSGLKIQLEQQLRDISANNKLIQEDQSQTSTQKLAAQLAADAAVVKAQQNFYDKLLSMSSEYNKEAVAKAKEGVEAANLARVLDSTKAVDAGLKDTKDEGETAADRIKIEAINRTIKILEAKKTATETAQAIKKIQDEANRELLRIDVVQLRKELDLYEQGKNSKLKTEKEYQDALLRYKQAEQKLIKDTAEITITQYEKFINTIKEFVKGFAESVFKIRKYTQEEKDAGVDAREAEAQSYRDLNQALTEAYQNYFTNEAAKVDREHDVLSERLDNETKVKEARAQSQAEIDTIDKEAAIKKKQLDKQASDEKKKLALKQLAIDFALAVIKSLAQYGLPLALIPIAAETALYAIQRANIQKQQFAFGGQPGEVPTQGGSFGGRQHSQGGTSFSFKGKNYNAEVRELAIIRTRNAPRNEKYSVTGTQMQIASAINRIGGGRSFLSGATVQKFDSGGYFGERLQPPVFTARPNTVINNTGIPDAKFDQFTSGIKEAINAINSRIDRIQVVQVTKTVTDAQRKAVQQSGIASFGSKK